MREVFHGDCGFPTKSRDPAYPVIHTILNFFGMGFLISKEARLSGSFRKGERGPATPYPYKIGFFSVKKIYA